MNYAHFKEFIHVYIRITHSYFQMLYGYWKISRLPEPVVSIFGSSRVTQEDTYALKAAELAGMLVANNISVLTGGGPGIMQAVNCAAFVTKNKPVQSIGIGVTELGETPNKCVNTFLQMRYFFARKWLLTRHSVGFVVFPGGFGTLDEFAEILTLMQTKRMPRYPLILVGVEYWTPLINWLNVEAIKHGTVIPDELNLFIVSDDLKTILCTLQQQCPIVPNQTKQ